MDDETRERMDAAFEKIGEMVRQWIFDHDDGLEMLMRLEAGSAFLQITNQGVWFVDTTEVGVVVRDPDTG